MTNRQQQFGGEGLSGNVKAAYPVLLHSLAFMPILYTWNLLNDIFELADWMTEGSEDRGRTIRRRLASSFRRGN